MDRMRLRDGDGALILRLGAVGDVVRTLPCLARLRESLPGVRLGWVVEPPSASLLPGPPWLDRVFVFPRTELQPGRLLHHPTSGMGSLRRFLTELIAFAPRVTLDFQGSLKSALLGALSGAGLRIGFDRSGSREGSSFLSHLRVRPSSARLNRVYKNLELLSPLGLKDGAVTFPFPEMPPSEKVAVFLSSLSNRIRIAVHPGTSRRQDHKRWPVENYARLVSLLARDGWAAILTWGPGEEDLVREIRRRSSGAGIPAPATSLPELRLLLAGCHLFVGGDTGPMHLAWTQGVPVVALFGATDPLINGPLGEAHRVLAPAWGGASPSPERGNRQEIRRIDPESVWSAVREVLFLQQRLLGTSPVR